VSEDEAFIRAIVDSPGDDLPRLVYADWLDDRDDPRGPYLRAEFEWAKPWRSGQRPAESTKLRTLAAVGLDPVWVARVSRPPVGVCCEHLSFKGGGRLPAQADVRTFESHLGAALPPDYSGFLLNYNGGRTDGAWFNVVGEEDRLNVEFFYSLGWGDAGLGSSSPSLNGFQGVGRDARRLLPVGQCDNDDTLIVLDALGSSPGEVILFDDYVDPCLTLLAPSFAGFLYMLSATQTTKPE
jgi:uncharacterized protein (TIGR02996 family)